VRGIWYNSKVLGFQSLVVDATLWDPLDSEVMVNELHLVSVFNSSNEKLTQRWKSYSLVLCFPFLGKTFRGFLC